LKSYKLSALLPRMEPAMELTWHSCSVC